MLSSIKCFITVKSIIQFFILTFNCISIRSRHMITLSTSLLVNTFTFVLCRLWWPIKAIFNAYHPHPFSLLMCRNIRPTGNESERQNPYQQNQTNTFWFGLWFTLIFSTLTLIFNYRYTGLNTRLLIQTTKTAEPEHPH